MVGATEEIKVQNKTFRYPPWVNPGQVILGDVRYEQVDGRWMKHYWTGRDWVNEKRAKPQLIAHSEKRQKHVDHVQRVRKTGL